MTSLFSDEPSVDLSPDDSTLTEAGILVVDEDPAFQLGLKTFLKEYVGFEKVFTARNGREAIEMIDQEDSIELLTVDFQMPVMNGIDMLKELRERAPRPLGVTMITGFPSIELKQEFSDLTSSKLLTTHFLSKPVEFEKLEPVILDSYEELKRSQMLTDTMTGGDDVVEDFEDGELNASALVEANREMMAKLELMEEKLEQNSRALQNLGRRRILSSFFGDIFKFLVAAAIVFYAWQSGLVTKITDKLNFPPKAATIEQVEVAKPAPKKKPKPVKAEVTTAPAPVISVPAVVETPPAPIPEKPKAPVVKVVPAVEN